MFMLYMLLTLNLMKLIFKVGDVRKCLLLTTITDGLALDPNYTFGPKVCPKRGRKINTFIKY